MKLLLFIVFVIALFFISSKLRRNTPELTVLSALKLRALDDALKAKKALSQGQVLVCSLCFVDSDPELDISRITGYLKKSWGVDSSLSTSDSELERAVTVGETRLTFEPLMIAPGAELPEQVIPEKPARAPGESIGCVLVSASSPSGGLAASLGLSQGVLALVNTCPQVHEVYWMSSEAFIGRRDVNKKLKTNYKEHDWPVSVWVSTHVFTNDNGAVSGYTLGLSKMGGRELEAIDAFESLAQLKERLNSAAARVVNLLAKAKNGDAIGEDEYQRIGLKKAVSQTIHSGSVFHLNVDSD